MRKTNKCLLNITLVCLILLASLVPALAKDKEFDEIVKFIEKTYHAKKTGIPMLGIANFALKFAHPAGVKNIKVAVFEDQNFTSVNSGTNFELTIQKIVSQNWQPLIRVFSRKDKEWTYVYVKEENKDTKLLVVTLDQHDATVVELKANMDTLASWVQNPDSFDKMLNDFGFSNRNKHKNKDDSFADSFADSFGEFFHIADKEANSNDNKSLASTSTNASANSSSTSNTSSELPILKTSKNKH